MPTALPSPVIGSRFERWTVVSERFSNGKQSVVNCRCDCGVTA